MNTALRVTLIDEDTTSRAVLARHLRDERFDVVESGTCRDMHGFGPHTTPECVVLAMQASGPDGYQSIRDFRAHDDRPMLALNCRDHAVDRIIALDLGAYDVVDRGADPREVSARIRAILRRMRGSHFGDHSDRGQVTVLRFGRWSIDVVHRRVFAPAQGEVDMTSGEFDILRCFVENPLRPLTRQEILDATRGARCAGYERSIDVLIGRIRRKIEDDQSNPRLIQTVRGIGYVFASIVQSG